MSHSLLLQQVTRPAVPVEETEGRLRVIQRRLLEESPVLDAANFSQFHVSDLQRMFELYDEMFFKGACQQALESSRLRFRISSRMTSAGGKTTRFSRRDSPQTRFYEIAVSSTLLFQTFHDVRRPIRVTGRACHSRIEALQRVFEHELIHLVEMLLWETSSCSRSRFQLMAEGMFGHTEHRHALITPRERASQRFGLRLGMSVRFQLDGVMYVGVVNRITKRATVLVPDPRGERYSNGLRYAKFYVPFEMIEILPAR